MNRNLVAYYNSRAKEYDQVYLNPAEQNDLQASAQILQALFAGKNVLEIACGTGYWTGLIARTATSVYATDINESVIELAKNRYPEAGNISFAVADMFHLPTHKKYGGVFGGFAWSHILLQQLDGFLASLKTALDPGAVIAFMDSNMVAGGAHDRQRIVQTDEAGNTYQQRVLGDGSAHLVLKNFPTEEFLAQKLAGIGTGFHYERLEFYWVASCRMK